MPKNVLGVWVTAVTKLNETSALSGHLSKQEATDFSHGANPPHYSMPDYANDPQKCNAFSLPELSIQQCADVLASPYSSKKKN